MSPTTAGPGQAWHLTGLNLREGTAVTTLEGSENINIQTNSNYNPQAWRSVSRHTAKAPSFLPHSSEREKL